MFRFFVVFSWWPDTRAACPAGAKADTESCTAGHNGSSRHSQTGLELELGLAAWHMSNCLSPSAVESKQDHSKIVTLNFRPLPRSFTETGWVGCMAHVYPHLLGDLYTVLYDPSKNVILNWRPLSRSSTWTGWVGCMAHVYPNPLGDLISLDYGVPGTLSGKIRGSICQ